MQVNTFVINLSDLSGFQCRCECRDYMQIKRGVESFSITVCYIAHFVTLFPVY